MPFQAIEQGVAGLEGVPGRFEMVSSPNDDVNVLVDYAHTDDALRAVLGAVRALCGGRVISVFGCGGDRDAGKRPIRAQAGLSGADRVILTADNPRSEDPDTIIEEIEAGVEPVDYKKTVAITSRKQEIKAACQMAEENDIILIAGKGHETYQEVNGERTDFDDFKIVKELLTELNK